MTDAVPNYTSTDTKKGLQLAMQRGETAKERNSREILARHEARGRRLYERHGMPVDENPGWD
ncbi:hypothetical protein Slin14017_G025740 [Septoria linicola]|nr:hypothetical protein Slin14017_G025740 [Septoria linicola]